MIEKIINLKYLKSTLGILAGLIMMASLMPGAARATTVSPVTQELTGNPGGAVTSQIVVENEARAVKNLEVQIQEFVQSGESGVPKAVEGKKDIAGWIKPAKEVLTLQPLERKTLDYTVNIPADATPGGHFAVIFLADKGTEQGQVSINQSTGVLVFLTVSGELIEKGNIMEAGASPAQAFYSTQPVDLFYRFQNQGNNKVAPSGTVKIKNWFGHEVASLDANKLAGNTLPGAIRRYELSWNSAGYDGPHSGFFSAAGRQLRNFAFGNYTADINLAFGTTSKTATAQASFFMFPWQLLLLLLIIVIVIVWIIWWLKKSKGYSKKDKKSRK